MQMILIPQSNSDICELNEAERCYAADQQCTGSVLSQSYHTTAGVNLMHESKFFRAPSLI